MFVIFVEDTHTIPKKSHSMTHRCDPFLFVYFLRFRQDIEIRQSLHIYYNAGKIFNEIFSNIRLTRKSKATDGPQNSKTGLAVRQFYQYDSQVYYC